MMMNGRNNGKKLMAVRIVAHAFEIVRLLHEVTSIFQMINARLEYYFRSPQS